MTAHSTVGASVIKRRKVCPGSRRLEAMCKNRSSKDASEGTDAHELSETCLNSGVDATDYVGSVVGGSIVSQEMADAVQLYLDHVRGLLRADDGAILVVEHRFHLRSVHPDLFGTADAVVWQPGTQTLHVIDFKYGAGVPVEVKENMQLRYYALGALMESSRRAKVVVSTIVQPRCPHSDGPVRVESIDAIELIDYAAELIEIVKATEDPNAPLEASDECRFCNAAPICPALTEKRQRIATVEFQSATDEELAAILKDLPLVEAQCKAIREYAYAKASGGTNIPGWKLVEKRATRRWVDEAQAVTELARAGLKPEEYGSFSVFTPAALETKFGKTDVWENLTSLIVKESSGTTLVPDDDKRAAVVRGSEFNL